jgi:hypothetical protein
VPIAFVITSQTVGTTINIPIALGLSVPASLGGSQAVAQTGPAGSLTFSLNKTTSAFGTATVIGTIAFAAGSHTATFAGAGGALNVGDILQLICTTTDASFANAGITILTTRT